MKCQIRGNRRTKNNEATISRTGIPLCEKCVCLEPDEGERRRLNFADIPDTGSEGKNDKKHTAVTPRQTSFLEFVRKAESKAQSRQEETGPDPGQGEIVIRDLPIRQVRVCRNPNETIRNEARYTDPAAGIKEDKKI